MRPPYEIVEHPDGARFWLSGAWQNSYFEHLNNPDIREIYITWNNWLYQMESTDLSFIQELKHIREFRIFSAEKISIKPVESCSWLEAIEIDVPKQKDVIDFRAIQSRKKARVKYQKALDSIFDCTGIENLIIENFPYQNLERLASMKALSLLELIKSKKLKILIGWQSLPSLRQIQLYRCECFESTASLPESISLETEACKKFTGEDFG